ncbi:unnamed protein product [Brachionus calyciflorus]|uniref:Uncharacterized protein n=1 Tax=Brachionus calyciflorus TaxID=104777 RepID=A0A814SZ71_9BILA|nr:unnamed protein product [Brachionus calyciflorus]
MSDSVIVWKNSIVKKSQLKRIFKGHNFIRKNNLIYSLVNRYLFQISNPINDYGLELYPTTDGLFLVFEPPESSKMAQILASFLLEGDDNNIITPRDINDLMIAENDYLNYNVEEQIMHDHERKFGINRKFISFDL